MMLKKHKSKIITAVIIVALLFAAFWYGGNAPGARGLEGLKADKQDLTIPAADGVAIQGREEMPEPEQKQETGEDTAEPIEDGVRTPTESAENPDNGEEVTIPPPEDSSPAEDILKETDSDITPEAEEHNTAPEQTESPLPEELQEAEKGEVELTCTISVSCATILDNMDYLDKEKHELVPEDGCILEPVTVIFYEGESVFNVLQRTMRQNSIHLEFVNTPVYNSAYIEGINNIYEFDVGETSGWMYKVNDRFPNYGSSQYMLQEGDVIEWVYTCDLGSDVGGGYATGQ